MRSPALWVFHGEENAATAAVRTAFGAVGGYLVGRIASDRKTRVVTGPG